MTALWLSIIGLSVTAVIIIFLPLLLGRKTIAAVSDQQQQNIAIFKERLAELEQEKALGNTDEVSFLQMKTELEKTLLADVDGTNAVTFAPVPVAAKHWLIVGGLAFVTVLVSLAMYVDLGRSEDYGKYLIVKAQQQEEAQNIAATQEKLKKIIDLLKQKLKDDPRDMEKWLLLANSYAAVGQYHQAAQTYRDAMQYLEKSSPNYAALKGRYAQMLFQEADEKITPAVEQTIKETLALDPLESSALILTGIDAYNHGDIQQAIAQWEKAKIKASEDTVTGFIDPIINQAKVQRGKMPPQMASSGTAKITISLDLAPELKAKVKPEQAVFVFARPVGGKMPLAAEKLQVKDLPATIVLDDSKSPMPTASLSSVAEVDVTARVSLSGQPQEGKGDWFATLEKIKVKDEKPLEMLINQEVK